MFGKEIITPCPFRSWVIPWALDPAEPEEDYCVQCGGRAEPGEMLCEKCKEEEYGIQ